MAPIFFSSSPRAAAALAAGALALLACGSASAQVAGTWSVRAGFTHIAPQVKSGNLSAPSFPGTTVDVGSDTALTGGINYMVTDHWAIDVPLGLPFKHEFRGTGAIAGVGKVGETKVIPATVFAQYRFGEANSAFRPYVGLGVTYAKFFKERTTAALNGLTGGTPANPTTASIDDKWGITPQVGFVWNFSERWFVDAAYYKSFLKTTTHLSSGQSINIRLNPNVFSVGIGYRF
ncbi:outer membrane beta-barrel protein [Acidovorax sp. GBBC 3334]|uniref:OmpW/AlkL family protein n=1 Tax=Acidovorax sp. GBBC 3334 TaxID=2940496 RepID=UPI0023038EA2|nr:OmpW family outer membrane protein [Acidovorax sp. GBBC 3334]MDA8456467.1 outer membrane beta-barrel protein [Acidovorax sp. GBBC 3334]